MIQENKMDQNFFCKKVLQWDKCNIAEICNTLSKLKSIIDSSANYPDVIYSKIVACAIYRRIIKECLCEIDVNECEITEEIIEKCCDDMDSVLEAIADAISEDYSCYKNDLVNTLQKGVEDHQKLHDKSILAKSKEEEERCWVVHRALEALAEIKCNNCKNLKKVNI